jgi:hypothetical protein
LQDVSENKKQEFKRKPVGCDGVNLLEKQGRDTADASFDAFVKALNQKDLGWVVGPFTVAFAGGEQRLLARGGPHISYNRLKLR